MEQQKDQHPLSIWRRKNGVTGQELAGELQCSQSHLSEIERGNNRPSPELTARLHKRTGIPVKEFRPDLAHLFGVDP